VITFAVCIDIAAFRFAAKSARPISLQARFSYSNGCIFDGLIHPRIEILGLLVLVRAERCALPARIFLWAIFKKSTVICELISNISRLRCYKDTTNSKCMENIVDTETKLTRNKRKKFEDIAVRRVNRVIKEIRLIGNLSNRSSYEYSEDDVRKIVKALQREIDAVKTRFEGPGKGTDPVFSL
jgi:hypothetical protein